MKQLLFLLLFPCFAMAQYQGNGNQKITLGEQTTADGLVWRGIRADTTSKIVPFSDTSAYIILDTVEKTLWLYKAGQIPKWQQVGGSTLDTATMLLPYYRAGRNTIIQAADVPTLNQNTTGSAATLTTGRTIQTNLASTSAATFNGSANITPGITGTLGGANGGTGLTTFGAANNIPFASSTTVLKTNNRFYLQESGTIPILRVDGNIRLDNAGQFQFFNLNNNYAFSFSVASNSRIWLLQNNNGSDVFIARGPERSFGIRYNFADSAQVTEALSVNGNARITAMNGVNDIGASATGVLQAATSDMNLKNTIENSPFGLNEILLLNPVTFFYNDENRKIDSDVKEVGFIAQDVFDVIPNAVSSTGTGDLQLDYRAITAALTKAIQEQQALIKALEQRILNLENK